ncbi:MAG: hypothetical protein RI947_1248 [Candidatus Parcubacteria bacterium]|jgi:hypothetical protein
MTDTNSPLPALIEQCVAEFTTTFAAGDPSISFPEERREGVIELSWDLQLEWKANEITYRILVKLAEHLKGPRIEVRASATNAEGQSFESDVGAISTITEQNSPAWQVALRYILEVAYKTVGIWDADDFSGDTVYDNGEFHEKLYRFPGEQAFQDAMLHLNWKFTTTTAIQIEPIGDLAFLTRDRHADLIDAYLSGLPHSSVDVVHVRPNGRLHKSTILNNMPSYLSEMLTEVMESRGGPTDMEAFIRRQEKAMRKRRRQRRVKLAVEIYKNLTAFIIPMLVVYFLLALDRTEYTVFQSILLILTLALLVGRMIAELIAMRIELKELQE